MLSSSVSWCALSLPSILRNTPPSLRSFLFSGLVLLLSLPEDNQTTLATFPFLTYILSCSFCMTSNLFHIDRCNQLICVLPICLTVIYKRELFILFRALIKLVNFETYILWIIWTNIIMWIHDKDCIRIDIMKVD